MIVTIVCKVNKLGDFITRPNHGAANLLCWPDNFSISSMVRVSTSNCLWVASNPKLGAATYYVFETGVKTNVRHRPRQGWPEPKRRNNVRCAGLRSLNIFKLEPTNLNTAIEKGLLLPLPLLGVDTVLRLSTRKKSKMRR